MVESRIRQETEEQKDIIEVEYQPKKSFEVLDLGKSE
jgi:hypothetical protein